MIFQNSKKLFLASLLRSLPAYVAVVTLVWWGRAPLLNLIPRRALVIALVALLLVMIYSPIQAILTQKLEITSGELEHREGLILKSSTKFGLDQVSTVHLDRSWFLRIFGLAKMTISLRGTKFTPTMEGLSFDQSQNLSRFLESGLMPQKEDNPRDEATDEPRYVTPQLVFNLNSREIAASFLGSLPFVVATIIAAIGLIAEIYERFTLSSILNRASMSALIIGAIVLIVGTTLFIGYASIHNFSLSKGAIGEWKIRYGLFEPQERTISKEGSSSLRMTVGFVDSLFDTARARIGTGDPLQGSERQFHFPSLQTKRVQTLVSELFGYPPLEMRTHISSWLRYILFLIIGSLGLVLLGYWLGQPRYGILAGLVWLIAMPVLSSLVTTRIHISTNEMMEISFWRYGFVMDFIPLSAVSNVKYLEIPLIRMGFLQIGAYTQKEVRKISLARRSRFTSLLDEMQERM